MDAMWNIMMEQPQMSMGQIPDFPVENLQDMIKDCSMKLWVSKDTYLVTMMDMNMLMEVTAEAMGIPGGSGGFIIDTNMDMWLYDHNKPVTIWLPPEAEDAVYQSMY